jgi:hypothetical protein
MQEQFEEISTLAPFTAHCVTLVDDIGDGHVGRHSMKFQESFDKYSIDVNDE